MTATCTVEDGHGNIVEQTVDNGDGTGTRTVYDDTGETVHVETVDLPAPAPPDPTTVLLDQLLAVDPDLWPTLVDADPARVRGAVGVATALIASQPALNAVKTGTATAKATTSVTVLAAAAEAGATATQGDTP